jgi:hypothetical protein
MHNRFQHSPLAAIASLWAMGGVAEHARPLTFVMIDVLLPCVRRPGLAAAGASRLSCFSPVARAIVSVVIFAALICGPHRASAQFTQQSPKLVGTGGVGYNYQGFSVALSEHCHRGRAT